MKRAMPPRLIQVTSTGWSSRVTKILNEPLALLALTSGFEIEVHGWRKLKSNRNRQTIKVIPITVSDFGQINELQDLSTDSRNPVV